jgi:hypothetical protein
MPVDPSAPHPLADVLFALVAAWIAVQVMLRM